MNVATIQRLAMPVLEDQGLHSRLSPHFGRAPGFAIVNSDGTDYVYLNADSARQAGECAPIQGLSQRGGRVLYSQNMGRGALIRAHEAGFIIMHAEGCMTVGEVVTRHLCGENEDLPDSAICDHHNHGDHPHDHGHEHCSH